MKCRILINIPKTVNGQKMGPYTKGSVCELDEARSSLFIDSAMAEEVIDTPVAVEGDSVTGDGSGQALPEIVLPAEAKSGKSRKKSSK